MSPAPHRFRFAPIGCGVSLLIACLFAEVSHSEELTPREIEVAARADRLYQAVLIDLKAEKPLVVTTFVNLEYNGGRPPLAANMYWGGGYGYFSFFDSGMRSKFFKERFSDLTFERVLLTQQKRDPVRAAVFKASFAPAGQLAASGVKSAELYLVNLAWKKGWNGLVAAVNAAVQGTGDFRLITDEGIAIDAVRDARLLGFVGHNPRFDTRGTGPLRAATPSTRTVGVFAVGCMTGGAPDVKISPFLVKQNKVPLLFTRSFVSAEAYSFLGMVAAFIQGAPLSAVVARANDEYQAFQKHHGHRAGRPFISPEKVLPKSR